MEEKGGWRTAITPDLAGFLAEARSFYLATASADGQPYVQHRGGPPGFLRVRRRAHAGLCRLQGQPPVHHHRQPGRERQGLHLHHGLRAAPAREVCGAARAWWRPMPRCSPALARRLRGPPRAGHPVRGRGLGHQLPAAHPADVPRRGRGPAPSSSFRPASASWRRRSPRLEAAQAPAREPICSFRPAQHKACEVRSQCDAAADAPHPVREVGNLNARPSQPQQRTPGKIRLHRRLQETAGPGRPADARRGPPRYANGRP